MDKITLQANIYETIEKLQQISEDMLEIEDTDNDIEYYVYEKLRNLVKLIEQEVSYLKEKQ